MDQPLEQETLHALVRRIFFIEDIALGSPNGKEGYLVKYHGRIAQADTAAAYDQLAGDLKPYGITPLFRLEDGRQTVILVPGRPQPRQSNPKVNLVLFILTVFSVLFTGALYSTQGNFPSEPLAFVATMVTQGWPFAVSLLAILGAHEFGHYLMGRHHGVHVTLPYFIPLPISLFGTMGAFISMKESPKNRRVLLDIGLAGPLSGLVVAIPVLLIGLSLSQINQLPTTLGNGFGLQLEGNSLLYLASKYLIFGRLLPQPPDYAGLSPLLYWLRYFFTGQPLPLGGFDVTLHPVAWAGWAGILVTALNLIPAGQLDGGHVLYVLFGRKFAQRALPVVLLLVAGLGFFWNGWWLWAALIFLVGRAYAEPLDQITELDTRRKYLALLGLIVFILVFTPVPLIFVS